VASKDPRSSSPGVLVPESSMLFLLTILTASLIRFSTS
jgi:hypothetical protein